MQMSSAYDIMVKYVTYILLQKMVHRLLERTLCLFSAR